MLFVVCFSDAGIGKDGRPKDSFTRGMEIKGRVTLFGEGCRGSCSETIMKKFNLREGKCPQTYGLGIKEVWQIPEVTVIYIITVVADVVVAVLARFPSLSLTLVCSVVVAGSLQARFDSALDWLAVGHVHIRWHLLVSHGT